MIPKDVYYFIGSYLLILIGGFALINWLSAGIVRRFLLIKASRGKKILVKVHSKLRCYAVSGWLEGNELCFYDDESKANKQKTPKRIVAGKKAFYRFMGVYCCDFDEANNSLWDYEGVAVSGFDALRWNNIYLRALMKPANEEKDKVIFYIILGAVVILIFISVYLISSVNGLKVLVQAARNASTITGVNV